MKGKKILMLTMSCNIPYYQALLGAVRNTWAKPLIRNKYENITWFAYTACDKKHPTEYVDIKNHMIYVKCNDGLFDTYEKTQRAYNLVKNMVDFDYVVRTNTSTFVNIENMLNRLNEIYEDAIIGRIEYSNLSDRNTKEIFFEYWLIHGFFFGMKKEYFEFAISADKDYILQHYGKEIYGFSDDDIISMRIHDLLGNDFYTTSIEKSTHELILYETYSTNHKNSEKIKQIYRDCQDVATTDPSIINNKVIVKLKSSGNMFYEDFDDRVVNGREIEHYYELNNSLIS